MDTSTNRESDKIIVRLPHGMRDTLAELAAARGRSMNAEVVIALTRYVAVSKGKAEGGDIFLSEEGLFQISKFLVAGVNGLEQLLYDVRDVDLDAFISDQRDQGFNLTRTEAIRKILRAYLDERGYVHRTKKGDNKSPPA